MGQALFYADLNCPFCFALHERILAADLGGAIEWRGVEHAPHLPRPRSAGPDDRDLASELVSLADRAPEVLVRPPPHRPNSGHAIAAVAVVRRSDPAAADRLRARLFRAIWADGLDVSRPEVVAALGTELGVAPFEVDDASRAEVAGWTAEWRSGWDRIPVLVHPDGNTLVGLASARAIEVFLGFGLSSRTDGVCR